MFKKGDKVVCVDVSVKQYDSNSTIAESIDLFENVITGLVLNNIYTINYALDIGDYDFCGISLIELDNIDGETRMFMPKRFKSLTEVRKEKIKKLLNE